MTEFRHKNNEGRPVPRKCTAMLCFQCLFATGCAVGATIGLYYLANALGMGTEN